jgi:hypothetical protein
VDVAGSGWVAVKKCAHFELHFVKNGAILAEIRSFFFSFWQFGVVFRWFRLIFDGFYDKVLAAALKDMDPGQWLWLAVAGWQWGNALILSVIS